MVRWRNLSVVQTMPSTGVSAPEQLTESSGVRVRQTRAADCAYLSPRQTELTSVPTHRGKRLGTPDQEIELGLAGHCGSGALGLENRAKICAEQGSGQHA